MKEFGINFPNDFNELLNMPLEQAKVKLAQMKAKAKKAYKTLAKTYHPDVTGNDEAKTAWFKVLTSEMTELEKLEVAPKQAPMPIPPPMQTVVQINFPIPGNFGFPFANTSTSTTTGTIGGMPRVVVVTMPFRRS